MNMPKESEQVASLRTEGHTFHCACRIVFGDGECECEKRGLVPGPISRLMMENMEKQIPGSTGIAQPGQSAPRIGPDGQWAETTLLKRVPTTTEWAATPGVKEE